MTENRSVFYDPEAYTPLPDLICLAELIKITLENRKLDEKKNFVPLFKIKAVLEPKYSKYIGCVFKDLITVVKKTSAHSKLGILISELTGMKTADHVSLDNLIGKECYVKLVRTKKGNKVEYLRRKDVEGEECETPF